MRLKQILIEISKFVLVILIVILIYVSGIAHGYKAAHLTNVQGFNEALDTVEVMLKSAAISDTNHCTYLCIDTTKYYLSHKKVCN